ncbi:substrate-binding domain-containing protein [Salsipaludibacter albus]|uniref:substrate-binding domain-containing protein n=1 Tax=Salsipaludibacter albus TaxID=2849650 RepID=UPI001EE3DC7C|nr:substrate-binding domain-containing protein [Salsipaludibacter albus]MBY5162577.1 substrate-binding domain-containing protein [Salsipaludibacter albus]
MRIRNRGRAVAGLVLSLALVVTACGGDDGGDTSDTADDSSASGEAAEGGGGGGTGTIPIAGSSTVFPITAIVAEDFAAENEGADATVESTGTGGGFADFFCTGETAVNNASRAIAEDEVELCAENGVENILELQVAIDGMTVLTSPQNDAIAECLNFAEMYALVGPESGEVASWADANAIVGEVGEHASGEEFPDVPLTTTGPGTESGTYDSFIEIALEGIAEEQGVEPGVRPDWQGQNDDNVIVQGLAGNQYSFGWVGYAYFLEVQDQLRAFQVADEEGNCVEPNDETIASGEYPLSRPLFIYVNLDKLDEDYGSALEGFVDYYMGDGGYQAVADAGYVQLTDDAWAEVQAAWEARESNI